MGTGSQVAIQGGGGFVIEVRKSCGKESKLIPYTGYIVALVASS